MFTNYKLNFYIKQDSHNKWTRTYNPWTLIRNGWPLRHCLWVVTSGQRILTKGRIACRADVEDWMIPFAAYTSAETPNTFQWVGQPSKIAPYRGGSRPPPNTWFFGPTQVSPQTASRSVQPFLRGSPVCQTDGNTPVAIGRIYAMYAMRPRDTKTAMKGGLTSLSVPRYSISGGSTTLTAASCASSPRFFTRINSRSSWSWPTLRTYCPVSSLHTPPVRIIYD